MRPDGATRGDLTEALALLAAGALLASMPLLVLLDQLGETWLWLSLGGGTAGLLIAGVGLRWFFVQGPPMVSTGVEMEPALQGLGPVDLPLGMPLVAASSRMRAHALRFAAIGSGLLLLFFELGPLKWLVLFAFLLSFVADQLLLRPQRYIIDSAGMRPDSLIAREGVSWGDVRQLIWRHYPGAEQPPFPTGERVIIERRDAAPVEFVFHRRQGGTGGARLIRALTPLLRERIEILKPVEKDVIPQAPSAAESEPRPE